MTDLQIAILSYTISNTVCTVVVVLLWMQNRKLFAGLDFWLACFINQILAALCLVAYDRTASLLFMVAGNMLNISGMLLLYIGLGKFTEIPGRQTYNHILLLVFFVVYSYFTFLQPEPVARHVTSSLAILIIAAQCTWLIYYRLSKSTRAIITRRAGFIFIGYCVVAIARIVVELFVYQRNLVFSLQEVDVIFIIAYQILLFLLTFSLFLMVNRKLITDLQNDFADRMQVAGALREREELFHAIFDQAGVGVAQIVSTTWKIIRVNQKYCDLTGYSREELEKLYIRDFTHPDDVQENLNKIREMIHGENRGFTLEKRYIRKNGEITWVNLTVSPMWAPGEEPTTHISVVEDITERKYDEEKLRESENRLAAVIEGGRLGFSDWNIPAGVIERNERWASMLGYTLHEINTSYIQWEDLLHPDDRKRARQALQDHLDGKTDFHRDEYRLRAKDGTYRWILDQGRVVERAANGAPLRLSATHTDITERKQAEELLQKQYNYLAALQETTLELISQLDLNILLENIVRRAGALVGTNSGFLDLVDFQTNQLKPHIGMGTLVESLDHPAQAGEGIAGKVWQTGKPLAINDYDHWEGRIQSYSFSKIGPVIGVPLLSGNKVLGVLGLSYDIGSGKTFGKETIDILTQFARLVTIAIENTRLFSAAQQELAERTAAEAKLQDANQQLQLQLEEIQKLRDTLHDQAIRDPLTGLFNRRYMEEALKQEYARAMRKKYPLSIVLLDLDHLKTINDKYGHLTGGDKTLRLLAEQLTGLIRTGDVLCRYGGDEFLIILHDTTGRVARKRAEEWRKSISQIPIIYGDTKYFISFSAGIATFPTHGKTLENILLAADQALYHAKKAGRNCVMLYRVK